MRKTLNRVGGLVVAVVMALAATAAVVFGAAAPASAAGNVGSALYRGQQLNPGDYIQRVGSGGWYYWLIMQLDTNLVLYKGYSNHSVYRVCWASNTANYGWNDIYAIYQSDGNFVMYDYGFGDVYWASNTEGSGGSTVDINNYGQLYVGYTVMNSAC